MNRRSEIRTDRSVATCESGAAWNFVQFDYFDIDKRAEPFEPVSLGSGGAGGGGGGRWSPDPSLGSEAQWNGKPT